jgi:hypothetical protein
MSTRRHLPQNLFIQPISSNLLCRESMEINVGIDADFALFIKNLITFFGMNFTKRATDRSKEHEKLH